MNTWIGILGSASHGSQNAASVFRDKPSLSTICSGLRAGNGFHHCVLIWASMKQMCGRCWWADFCGRWTINFIRHGFCALSFLFLQKCPNSVIPSKSRNDCGELQNRRLHFLALFPAALAQARVDIWLIPSELNLNVVFLKFCLYSFSVCILLKGGVQIRQINTNTCCCCFLKKFLRCLFIFCLFIRVINAGKSTHNEDQASCEVLSVKKKAGGTNSTPNKNSSTKRRSSLPNGEGLQLKENSVSCRFPL